jgi:hypothetical protein
MDYLIDSPTVSVVISLYNKGNYVERALSSVFAQTYPPLEVIIVDDGSTDDGHEKVLNFNNPKIILVKQENKGPGSARNTGLAIAKGKYIAFLDADDEWYPSFLETGISCFNDNRNSISLISTGYVRSPLMRTNTNVLTQLNGIYEITTETDIKLIHNIEIFCSFCFSIMKTDTVRKLGGYFDRVRCLQGEDTYLLLKLLFNEKICIIPEPYGVYHTEASDLYCGGTKFMPALSPCFAYPEEIVASCPQHKRDILSKYLSMKALNSAVTYCKLGQKEKALELIDRFCRNGHFTKRAAAVRLLAEFAPLLPSVRKLRRSINQITGK